jgi:hypothetical protein
VLGVTKIKLINENIKEDGKKGDVLLTLVGFFFSCFLYISNQQMYLLTPSILL